MIRLILFPPAGTRRLLSGRLDQRKLERARRVLGAATDTETLERALDLVLAEEGTRRVLRSIGGKGRIGRVFP